MGYSQDLVLSVGKSCSPLSDLSHYSQLVAFSNTACFLCTGFPLEKGLQHSAECAFKKKGYTACCLGPQDKNEDEYPRMKKDLGLHN